MDTVIGAGVEILKTAVKGVELRDAVMAQAGAYLSGNSVPTETPKQIMERVDHAFKATGEAVQTVMNPVVSTVQSSIELATGSKRAGEVLTEPALMALTEGAFRLAKPALTVAKTGLRTAVNTVRHLEVTVDSAAFLRHNAGIPFDAVKITTKTPKVEVPTSTVKGNHTSYATAGEYVPTFKNGVCIDGSYHVKLRKGKSPAPLHGQKSLDNAVEVIDKKGRKTEGVLVSVNNDGGIVIFRNKSDKPGLPEYHGYVTTYKDVLTRHNDIKQALEIKGCFTEKGRFIKGTE